MYAPFKYAVNAYCLDNIQTFDRRYVTLEDALLHCLNGFNENANIPTVTSPSGITCRGNPDDGQCIDGLPEATGASPDRNTVGTSNNVTKE